jgi:flavin reductase (DIM6/NTAB) family NADH-FMN oxidoreductase RutF
VRGDLADAPYAAEFPVSLECRLLQTVKIGLHTQFIGEILNVLADESVLGEDGQPDIMKVQPLVFDAARRGYHGVGERLDQAFSVGQKFKK